MTSNIKLDEGVIDSTKDINNQARFDNICFWYNSLSNFELLNGKTG